MSKLSAPMFHNGEKMKQYEQQQKTKTTSKKNVRIFHILCFKGEKYWFLCSSTKVLVKKKTKEKKNSI